MKAQTIQIDSTFTSDGEIFPFSPNDTIYGLSISGSVVLHSDTSLVRIILTDITGQEWMVYEAYPMIVTDTAFDIVEECDETCYLSSLIPNSIKILLSNATISLELLFKQDNVLPNIENLITENSQFQESRKIDAINSFIEKVQSPWIAGSTSISQKSYQEKKSLFGGKYNLLGYDFYIGGIFIPSSNLNIEKDNSLLVKKFDWREKHNAHLEYHPYFDGNPDYAPRCNEGPFHELGNGWMTKVEDQSPYEPPQCSNSCNGCCYIFAPLGVMEAVMNLYFNYHYNLDLSEQYALNCSSIYCTCNGGGTTGEIFEMAIEDEGEINEGHIDEISLPWEDAKLECDEDLEFAYRLTIKDKVQRGNLNNIPPADEIKENLILHGPLQITIDIPGSSLDHSLILVGYGVLEAGDTIHTRWGEIIEIDKYPYLIGSQYWICKNSYSPFSGDQGYYYFINNSSSEYFYQIYHYTYIVPPVYIESNVSNYERHCYDKDNDGYYNWGLGEFDPLLCDQLCENLNEDSNDDNNRIGPYDNYYNGAPIMPAMKVNFKPNFSITPKYINNNSFISFSDNDLFEDSELHFYIKNSGDAQLNLRPWGINDERPVEIIDIEGGSQNFSIDDPGQPQSKVCMGDSNLFIVTFNGSVQGELTKIKIYVEENGEISDFEFILVYNDCQPSQGVIEITGNQYWDSFALKTKDYLIASGSTLTVTSDVAMGINSDIFVAPNGKLIIDGGRLTSACPAFWNGIDVWGEANRCQISTNQGMVEIKNGGMIEFADTAIATARFLNIYHYPSGGIVSCKDAVFKDNNYDVVFYPYTNTNPATHEIIGNASRFTRTRFETTNDYYDISHSAPGAHMKMNGVGGIRLGGCTFYNSSTQKDYSRGIGIESNDAGYVVNNYCAEDIIPCPEEQSCTFENLDYGIRAFNNNDYFPILVDSADFIHNRRGIYFGLINHPTIVKNRFDLSDPAGIWSNEPIIGLYLDEFTTGYVVEENQFSNNTTTSESFGIHLLNNGPVQNEIYNNSFSALSTAIMAVGDNRREDSGVGICIKCNDFTGCLDDISVTPAKDENGNDIITDNTGIALLQGEDGDGNDLAAGNTFSENAENNYINDDGCRHIDYTHHNENSTDEKLIPEPTAGDMDVNPDNDADYNKEESCPSNLTGGGITLSLEKLLLNTETELISDFQDSLSAMIDGGNTEGLNYEVQSSIPEEALEIRQDLLEESPFLSDTVMISAIEKEDVLPGAMVRDVLTANPHAPKSIEVMNALNQRQDTIPEYMMEDILEGLSVYGEKELLEQELGFHAAKRDRAWKNINHYFKGDTLNAGPYSDSLIALYQNENRQEAKYDLCFMYLSREDSLSLFNTLSDIPVEFDLSMDDLFIHNQYMDLFNILWDIKTDSTGLDSIRIQSLYSISTPIHSLPANYAYNLLINIGLIEYNEPVYTVELLKSVTVANLSPKVIKSPARLLIFPNPADNYFIVQYDLTSCMGPGMLAIADINGQEIKHYSLKDLRNQIVIGTKEYPSGVYLISLICGHKLMDSQKISIIR